MNSFDLYKKCQDAIEADDLDTLKNILELKPTLIHHYQFGAFGYGETLLVFACKIGRAQACFFLIDQGADLNYKSKEDWTPLHYACGCSQQIDICKILIDKGADINAKDTNGWTPLFHACSQGLEDVCKLLISHGSNINEMSRFRQTPLSVTSKKNKNICELLIENMTNENVNESYNFNGDKPLHWAVVDNRKDICELLVLKKGAIVDVKDAYGFTPLHRACECGYKDICEFLLDQGSDLNFRDNTNLSYPLHASAFDNKEITEMLILRGAFRHVNAKNRNGDTPLHKSSSRGSFENSKILLEHGANVNEKNMHGYTPLHLALLGNIKEDVCELLIEHGADVDAIDNLGNTPISYILDYTITGKKICKLLEETRTRSRTASRRMDLLKLFATDE